MNSITPTRAKSEKKFLLKKDTLIFIFLDKTRFLLKTPLLKAKNFTSKKLSFPNACFFELLAVWMLELTYLLVEKQRHAGVVSGKTATCRPKSGLFT